MNHKSIILNKRNKSEKEIQSDLVCKSLHKVEFICIQHIYPQRNIHVSGSVLIFRLKHGECMQAVK